MIVVGRIRTIKPEFFRHRGLNRLDAGDRLLFIGLWCLADREGRLEDDPELLRVVIAPTMETAARVDVGLAALAGGGFITRYEHEGRRLIQVNRLKSHQRFDHREPMSKLPGPEEKHAPATTQSLGELFGGSAPPGNARALPGHCRGTPGWEGEGEGEGEGSRGRGSSDQPPGSEQGRSVHGRPLKSDTQLPRETSQGGSNGARRSDRETPEQLLDAYHRLCLKMPKVQELHQGRRTHARVRLSEHPLAWWEQVFARAAVSKFLNGEVEPAPGRRTSFQADFDWFIRGPGNAVKVVEGKYDNRRDDDRDEPRKRRML